MQRLRQMWSTWKASKADRAERAPGRWKKPKADRVARAPGRWKMWSPWRQKDEGGNSSRHEVRHIITKRNNYLVLLFTCMMSMPQLQILLNSSLERDEAYYMVPVIVLLLVAGLPTLYMEIFLGQYARQSPLHMWKLAPVAFGYFIFLNFIGVLLTALEGVHPAENLMYLYSVVADDMPWATCRDELYPFPPNMTCIDSVDHMIPLNPTCKEVPFKDFITCITPENTTVQYRFSTTQYFLKALWTQQIKKESTMNWNFFYALTANTLIMSAMLVYKPLYPVFATVAISSYALFVALVFVMSLFKPGSAKGIGLMLSLKAAPLIEFQTWWRSLYFVIAFMGLSLPSTMSFSARIGTECNPVRSARLVTLLVFLTLVAYTMMSFSLVGYMAHAWHTGFIAFRCSRDGFMFATLPLGLHMLPMRSLTVILYFFLSWITSLMHQVCICSGTVLGITAYFKSDRHYRPVAFVYCMFLYGFACTFATDQGMIYWFTIVTNTVKPWGILLAFTAKVSLVFWIYGVPRLSEDILFMVGFKPSILWRIMWSVTPCVAIGISIWQTFVAEQKLKGFMPQTYVVGTYLWYAIVTVIPVGLLYKLVGHAARSRMTMIVEPTMEWGPPNEALRKERKLFYPRNTIPSQPETRDKMNYALWNLERRVILAKRKKEEKLAGKSERIYY